MHNTLPLWPPDAPGIDIHAVERWDEPEKVYNICNPTLTVFEPPPEKRNGTAMVICPGGGYQMVSCPNEGWPVAHWLNDLGVCAYVLKYRVPGEKENPEYRHPVPLTDAQRALRMVRSSAAERGIRENHIGILGFSAGGHLAALASTQFDHPIQPDPVSCRPAFSVLVYSALHLYQTGGHGFGMGTPPHDSAQWSSACAAWLRDTGWM